MAIRRTEPGGPSRCCDAALLSGGKARLAMVGRLGARRMAIDELGVTGNDQQGRKSGRHDVSQPDAEVGQVELVECSRWRHTCQLDSKLEFGCTVFSQETTLNGD